MQKVSKVVAVYLNGIDTKRTMVGVANKLLASKTADEIKVREVASKCNCSPAAIYRHFDSLEYLLYVSSIGYLEDYMNEFKQIHESDKPTLERYLSGWVLFNKYAFCRPDIYFRLFWGKYNSNFYRAMSEYFELFPQKDEGPEQDFFYQMLFANGNLQQRDLMILTIASTKNIITAEDAEFLSITNPILVETYLRKNIDSTKDEREKGRKECNNLIAQNLERVNKYKNIKTAKSSKRGGL